MLITNYENSTAPLRALILEDEQPSLTNLKRLISRSKHDVKIVAEGGSVKDGLRLLDNSQNNIDVAFLDIKLTDGLSLQLLPKLAELDMDFVFCTAYNDYTLEAFQHNALHYIMKPFDPDEIAEALERAIIRKSIKKDQGKTIGSTPQKPLPAKTMFSDRKGTYMVHFDNIMYCEGDDNCTFIHINRKEQKRLFISKTLKKIVAQISVRPHFYRIHRKYFVNTNYIDSVVTEGKQTFVILKNEEKLEVSRRRKAGLMSFLDDK